MSSNDLAEEHGAQNRLQTPLDVAVLAPCYNEEGAIAKVVADFRAALPGASVYVYDNNSTDGTVTAATAAGAVVRRETHQGNGYVVRRMFNDIEADLSVLVDGEEAKLIVYPALRAPGEDRRRS
jgi:glycosyltransferase involved in cell wall biosynthesis